MFSSYVVSILRDITIYRGSRHRVKVVTHAIRTAQAPLFVKMFKKAYFYNKSHWTNFIIEGKYIVWYSNNYSPTSWIRRSCTTPKTGPGTVHVRKTGGAGCKSETEIKQSDWTTTYVGTTDRMLDFTKTPKTNSKNPQKLKIP